MSGPTPDVKSVFGKALELPSATERAAYLDAACAGHPALRAEVNALLQALGQAGDFLNAPPPDTTRSLPDPNRTGSLPPANEKPGTIIAGRYKLLQQIGEGGMGAVWMADQTEPVKRRVAVKLIRADRAASRTILSRFEAERQAIALMNHPHIAKLLDAGTTDEGSPFFVMELVKGVPLADYCDTHKLSVQERLHLFGQICSAVHHAHQKGIIHRDLKPTNILVESHDGKPVPKVIDFGLAKATTGMQLTEHTLFTGFGNVMGTPLYMAPEQATFNAIDVDSRADIYALGVILYELLSGSTPIHKDTLKTAALDEMLRVIREQEPPPPSSRIDTSEAKPSIAANRQSEPVKLGRFVRGELDWIVMKSLSKERERRYESATAFAADVERFLAHEPVTAGPPSQWYRLRKFVRRNKGRVVAAGLVLFTLIAGILGTSMGLLEARRQAGIAQSNETTALSAQQDAIRSADDANRERLAALTAKGELRRNLYLASMKLIPSLSKADQIGRVIELLDQQRPQPGEEDIRGLEWHYWDRQCRTERRVWDVSQYSFPYILSGDGKRGAFLRIPPPVDGKTEPGVIEILDLATEKVVCTIPAPEQTKNRGRLRLDDTGSRLMTQIDSTKRVPPVPPNRFLVWDTATGRELVSSALSSLSTNELRATISPSGKRFVVVDNGGDGWPAVFSIRVWDLDDATRAPAQFSISDRGERESGVTRQLESLALSRDGKKLAVVVRKLAFPRQTDPNRLVSVNVSVHMVDTDTGKSLTPFELHGSAASTSRSWSSWIAFSPDANKLALALALPLQTILLDVSSGDAVKELRTTPIKTELAADAVVVAYSPDGKHLAVVSPPTPNVWLLDAASGTQRTVFKSFGWARYVTFNSDGSRLLAIYEPKPDSGAGLAVKEWDVPPPEAKPPVSASGNGETITVRSRDGNRIAEYKPSLGTVTVRDRSGKQLHVVSVPRTRSNRVPMGMEWAENPVGFTEVVFSPNGRHLLLASPSEEKICDTDTGQIKWTRKPALGTFAINSPNDFGQTRIPIIISEDAKLLTYQEKDGAKVMSFDDLKERVNITTKPVTQLYFNPDGSRVVAVVRQGRFGSFIIDPTTIEAMSLWDTATGKLIHSEPVGPKSVSFSADSRVFVVDGTTAWDATTGEKLSSFRFGARVTPGVLNTSGSSYLSWESGHITDTHALPSAWDTRSGKIRFRLDGISGRVLSAIFSPDGRRIATLSQEGTDKEIRLWDALSGRELLTLPIGFRGSWLRFTPDGQQLHVMRDDDIVFTLDGTPQPDA